MVQSQITVLFTLAMFGTDWNASICLPYAFSKAKTMFANAHIHDFFENPIGKQTKNIFNIVPNFLKQDNHNPSNNGWNINVFPHTNPFLLLFRNKRVPALGNIVNPFLPVGKQPFCMFRKNRPSEETSKTPGGLLLSPSHLLERKKMRTIADIQMDLLRLKNRMQLSALSNDSYFLSAQYKEDCRKKFELEQELQKKWETKRRIDIETAY